MLNIEKPDKNHPFDRLSQRLQTWIGMHQKDSYGRRTEKERTD